MTTPYYHDETSGISIYHGDCRDILPELEPASVDLVLTDPPYGVRYVTARRSHNDPLVAPIAGDESLDAMADVVPEIHRLLANDRHAYFFASPQMIGPATSFVAASFKVKNVIIWDKGDAGTVGDLEAGFGVNWEAVIYASKGRRPLIGPRPRAMIRYDWTGTRDPVHPAVKPVAVLRWIVSKSATLGEMTLDPFMGSGTTLRAAKDLGCRAIGIEIEERYCEIAVRRLQQAVLPGLAGAAE